MFRKIIFAPKVLAILFSIAIGACTLEPKLRLDASPNTDNRCAQLANYRLPHGTVVEAEEIPAGLYDAEDGKSYQVPSFCRLHIYSTPTQQSAINIALWMPTSGWNGRYHQHGEGGMGGAINYASLAKLLGEGNAVAATDDGHDRSSAVGMNWALEEQKIIDGFGVALKETHDKAIALIKTYYTKAPSFNYFSGCSGGGRQAFIAAQRYPNDWDGILAGAPSFNTTQQFSSAARYGQLWLNHPEGRIPPQKLAAIQETALASCEPEAHLVDGIAGDPRYCKPEAKALACSGAETDQCLTLPQQKMLAAIYSGAAPESSHDKRFMGIAPTLEKTGDLKSWITGANLDNESPPYLLTAANGFYSNFVRRDSHWDVAKFDIDKDPLLAKSIKIQGRDLSSIIDATSPDLRPLQKSGAKLIVYSGWGDFGVLPGSVISYYNDVVERLGGFDRTQSFFRLFMVPGMGHCSGGPGANTFGQRHGADGLYKDGDHDIVNALHAWVEKGVAPERIIAAKYINDNRAQGIAFTRPLCAYPKVRVYSGRGDRREASNFKCEKKRGQVSY